MIKYKATSIVNFVHSISIASTYIFQSNEFTIIY